MSRTVMVWTHVELLPQASVARQVREMTFALPQVVEVASVYVIMGVPQLSMAVATPVVLVVVTAGQSSVTLAGQVITGAVVSTNVTVWLHWAVFPQASVARQMRVAIKVLPQPALVVVLRMLSEFVPHVSVTVGTSKVHAMPHSTLLLPEQVMTGAVVSTTVTV